MEKVKVTERGWPGHFCCAPYCLFRRNTLLEYKDIKIVVSTVGFYFNEHLRKFVEIGCERYYETMAFHSLANDDKYHDADVSREVQFESKWSIDYLYADDEANEMHENVVNELTDKLLKGELE